MITSIKSNSGSGILFGKARRAILSLLFGHADEAFYLRQIVRATGFGLGPVQRELKRLTESEIIRRTVSGRQVYFQANLDSPIYSELRGIIIKTAGIGDTLRAALTSISGRIEVAFIYGSVARGQEVRGSDIDLFLVGNVAFADVVINLQQAQRLLGREITPTVYPPDEFKAKVRAKHHFLTSVLKEPKIYLIGDENELRKLVEKRLARRA